MFGRPKLSRVLDQSFKHPLEFKKPQLKLKFGQPKFESVDSEHPDQDQMVMIKSKWLVQCIKCNNNHISIWLINLIVGVIERVL